MRKYVWILAGLTVWAACFINSSFGDEISWEDIGRGNTHLKAVLVDPGNPRVIYMGSGSGIFKTEDGGGTWRNIFSLKGQNRLINFLAFGYENKYSLYAATGDGLFYSANEGKDWKRVFKGRNYSESECITVAALPFAVYLGTGSGLFISKDNNRTWHKAGNWLGNSRILSIAHNIHTPDNAYVVCVGGVFRTLNRGESWEKIFTDSPKEDGGEGQEHADDSDDPAQSSSLRYISIDPGDASHLCLATAGGVYESRDKGQTWEKLTDYGLLSRDEKFIKITAKRAIYGVTRSGIFEYNNERWKELSFTLSAGQINSLDTDNNGNLYAACDKGLFKAREEGFNRNTNDSIAALYSQGEPKIEEVQKAAIEYAEVQPEKILDWRKQAAKKAWLPQISTGVNRRTGDLWHWETGSTTKPDDDNLRKGRDSLDWDVRLTWDLGGIIWNDDQTSIDVRSRLMVQLRNDILDEVTKIYFERLRVKMEMDSLSIEDRKKRVEKELRLKELTAELNSLTGGYFSRNIAG